ncbi:MAG TPA: hypothetical protein VNW30_12440 [Opitutaceae bacterium]|jgi:hypothetical protein|nr:hypothetical protein [Opitutaceae bacterium]
MKILPVIAGVLLVGGCASRTKCGKQAIGDVITAPASEAETLPAAESDPKNPDYLRAHLKSYGLVPFADDTKADQATRYRFLWIRSLRYPAALFEVRFDSSGTGIYEAKLWKKQAGAFQWVTQRTILLKKSDLDFHQYMLAKSHFFEVPWWDEKSGYYDGADWFIEVQQGDRYHAVYRQSPQRGPVFDFGRFLIESAIQSEFLPIY